MKKTTITVCITFTEPLLGTRSGDKDLAKTHLESKAPKPELAAEESALLAAMHLEEEMEKGRTIFLKDETGVLLLDYQLRGFIKETVGDLIELGDIKKLSKWACKRAINAFVFVNPRLVYLKTADGKPIMDVKEYLQRPLRAQTMQGERVALASSEILPVGTNITFTITVLESTNPKANTAVLGLDDMKNVLDFGTFKGIGQWRSGGYGRFSWKEIPGEQSKAAA
jgi:hypothetical protein